MIQILKNNAVRLNVLSLFVLFLTSCNISKDKDISEISEQGIDGAWNISNIAGGLQNTNTDYNPDLIVWIFNEDSLILTIQNSQISTSNYTGLSSGDYNYSIEEIGNQFFLFIENNEFGYLEVGDNELSINQNIASQGAMNDGYLITYNR